MQTRPVFCTTDIRVVLRMKLVDPTFGFFHGLLKSGGQIIADPAGRTRRGAVTPTDLAQV